MENRFLLRSATISDAEQLEKLSQKTFYETFVEDFKIPYPDEDLQEHFRANCSESFYLKKINDQRKAVWVIEDQTDHRLIGYAIFGPWEDIPHPDVQPDQDPELNRLYILRDYRDHGFGKKFMKIILTWFNEHYANRPIWLSVWSKNYKAQRFYQHYGFSLVGEYLFPVGQFHDEEFIMKRPADI